MRLFSCHPSHLEKLHSVTRKADAVLLCSNCFVCFLKLMARVVAHCQRVARVTLLGPQWKSFCPLAYIFFSFTHPCLKWILNGRGKEIRICKEMAHVISWFWTSEMNMNKIGRPEAVRPAQMSVSDKKLTVWSWANHCLISQVCCEDTVGGLENSRRTNNKV